MAESLSLKMLLSKAVLFALAILWNCIGDMDLEEPGVVDTQDRKIMVLKAIHATSNNNHELDVIM